MGDNTGRTIFLDGEEVPFDGGETIFQVAERHHKDIPTLCYDDRLEAFGGCRLCVVEVEGARTPVASCTTMAIDLWLKIERLLYKLRMISGEVDGIAVVRDILYLVVVTVWRA